MIQFKCGFKTQNEGGYSSKRKLLPSGRRFSLPTFRRGVGNQVRRNKAYRRAARGRSRWPPPTGRRARAAGIHRPLSPTARAFTH